MNRSNLKYYHRPKYKILQFLIILWLFTSSSYILAQDKFYLSDKELLEEIFGVWEVYAYVQSVRYWSEGEEIQEEIELKKWIGKKIKFSPMKIEWQNVFQDNKNFDYILYDYISKKNSRWWNFFYSRELLEYKSEWYDTKKFSIEPYDRITLINFENMTMKNYNEKEIPFINKEKNNYTSHDVLIYDYRSRDILFGTKISFHGGFLKLRKISKEKKISQNLLPRVVQYQPFVRDLTGNIIVKTIDSYNSENGKKMTLVTVVDPKNETAEILKRIRGDWKIINIVGKGNLISDPKDWIGSIITITQSKIIFKGNLPEYDLYNDSRVCKFNHKKIISAYWDVRQSLIENLKQEFFVPLPSYLRIYPQKADLEAAEILIEENEPITLLYFDQCDNTAFSKIFSVKDQYLFFAISDVFFFMEKN